MIFPDGSKLQAEASGRLHVADHGLGVDLAFLYQKMKLGLGAGRELPWRFDEKTACTEIANS
jgi:hypothetical protein